MENSTKKEKLKDILHNSSYAVFFGGAGVSTESGIPDFRSSGGLYVSGNEADAPEYMLSCECLEREPGRFFEYYRKNMIYPEAVPNKAHYALKQLEDDGIIKAVITQNIDGLHQMAGSRRVYELHGSVHRNYCVKCGKHFSTDYILSGSGVPVCDSCGGIVRPDIVLYGEGLDMKCFYGAQREINKADVLIAGGSSLVVNPAAMLVSRYAGRHLVIINYTPTPCDMYAELVIRESISDVLDAAAHNH